MKNHARPSRRSPSWPLIALAAWLVPGAGHALMGELHRAVILGLTILTLFAAGLLISGIAIVDRTDNRVVFVGQMFIGPLAFAADHAHNRLQQHRRRQVEDHARTTGLEVDDQDPEDQSDHDGPALHDMLDKDLPLAYQTPIGRPNELGALYTAVAGLLNLLVVLDAVGRASAAEEEPQSLPTET